jgi:hypothetical protein
MARDRQGAMKIVQMSSIQPYGLLSAPAKALRPRRIAQDYMLTVSRFFEQNFYTLIVVWGIKNLNRRCMTALHGEFSKGKFFSRRTPTSPARAKLKSNFNSRLCS